MLTSRRQAGIKRPQAPSDAATARQSDWPCTSADVSENLDIIPAKFFVHRHIYGKWVCKCCQQIRQEPIEPDAGDGGIPASGLVAHTLISRFVGHLPYYRQEPINARSCVHTPRSTLVVHRRFILGYPVLHADETPVLMQSLASVMGCRRVECKAALAALARCATTSQHPSDRARWRA